MTQRTPYTFYEFFAGGGMVRAGLGEDWQCLFANDNDPKKAESYQRNWGSDDLLVQNIYDITLTDLPGETDLAWASFPCQDLSLAGNRGGLKSARSGTFWPFWRLMQGLRGEGRPPKLILLENVYGALTSRKGQDFAALFAALAEIGYKIGPVVIDAACFIPQSRVRLFIIAVRDDLIIPDSLLANGPESLWHPTAMLRVGQQLSASMVHRWLWWHMPTPIARNHSFIDLIEDEPTDVTWHSEEDTRKLLAMMSLVNQKKVEYAQSIGRRMVGGVYRRTRNGQQRAEVRFDNVSGCLRTPSGGSSRQLLLVVEGQTVRSRLLSAREAARLMGLSDDYILPNNYNAAYHLAGDGVVVPVVAYLSSQLLKPLLQANLRECQWVA